MMRLATGGSKVHLSFEATTSATPEPQSRGATVRAPSAPVKVGPADMEQLAHNVGRIMEESGRALAAYLKPREQGKVDDQYAELTDVFKTLGQVADYWLRDPQRAIELQSSLGKAYLD